ncbi:MAG TPA: hypothetical protein VIH71_02650 [Solirubrobacteraceae bacterium]
MIAKLLMALYPQAWRERYGTELAALLEQTGCGPRTAIDVIGAAAKAHLRPVTKLAPPERARLTVSGVLACFMCFGFAAAAFAKTIEEPSFATAGRAHAVLGAAHVAIVVAGVVSMGALILAALPLARRAILEALRREDRTLRTAVLVPGVALASWALTLGALAVWEGRHPGDFGAVGVTLFLVSAMVGLGAAFACWLLPRAIMRRIGGLERELSLAVPALALVAVAMAMCTLALGIYLAALLADAPGLAASANGPGGFTNVAVGIVVQLVAMTLASAVACVSARRGIRAVRHFA